MRLAGLSERPKPDQVRGHGPEPGVDQHGDHVAVEVAPGRLAVEEEHHRGVRVALVEVVDPQRAALAVGDLGVVRLERVAGQVREAVVRRAQRVHQGSPS